MFFSEKKANFCPVLSYFKENKPIIFNHCRWNALKESLVERRSKLGESQSLQSVSRDVDDIEAWISEKLQTAMDESYKDPSNIQVFYHLIRKIHTLLPLIFGPP